MPPSVPGRSAARLTAAAFLAATALLVAACGGSVPATAVPLTPQPSPTIAGPTEFATWTARQGFGGSSGLNEVHKLIEWIGNHPSEVTVAMLDQEEIAEVRGLSAWLALHPPTSCWAEYHAVVSAALGTLEDDLGTARASVEAGKGFPTELAATMTDLAAKLEAMPAPAGCP